jgi:hypothetical protein
MRPPAPSSPSQGGLARVDGAPVPRRPVSRVLSQRERRPSRTFAHWRKDAGYAPTI